MKIIKFAYMPVILTLVLLISVPAQAATSMVTMSFTDTSGTSHNIRAYSYTSIDPDLTEVEQITINDTTVIDQYYTWNLSENISITGFDSDKYYTGWVYFRLTITPTYSNTSISNWTLESNIQENGLSTYIGYTSTRYIQIGVHFDNYKPVEPLIGLPTITFTATSSNNDTVEQSFTASLSSISINLQANEGAINNALTAMIYSAVSQATAPELESILSMLTDIRNQDYTYYIQLTSQLASVLSNQATELQRLQSILNELDTDFEDVQTILDLFPSYRTQVLEYWQQLLEMNSEQSSAAADMESEYADKNDQSNNLLSGLGNITYPSISARDVDIMSNVDSETKTNFFGMLSLITNNSLITTILLIVITGMIVGYILYGKR